MIGNDVSITVLDINGKQVRIGIDAPAEIKVHRKEIYLRIQQEEGGAAHDDDAHNDDNVGNQAIASATPVTTAHQPTISVRQRTRFSVPDMG